MQQPTFCVQLGANGEYELELDVAAPIAPQFRWQLFAALPGIALAFLPVLQDLPCVRALVRACVRVCVCVSVTGAGGFRFSVET